jgi:uncharacterized protein (TIGR04255 family)
MGKRMKNAPVYFTIAQVRHNPVLRLGAYADEIQDRMRKAGYPDFKKAMSMAFSLMGQDTDGQQPGLPTLEKVERLMFFSSDNTRGFIVEQNAFSFHTTEYDTFETFSEEFVKGLSIVHECIALAHTERIGLRYLDAIIPPTGEDGLAEFLTPGVLGLSRVLSDEMKVSHTMTETHFRGQGCAVLARTIIQDGPLGFPMDLQPVGMRLPDRFLKVNGVHAIVDTDAFIEGRSVLDIDDIKKQLVTLREGIDVAFNAIVTKNALDAWHA